jgi:hypothetical protein
MEGGYGASQGCCIVFDTKGLIELLTEECEAYNYLNIFFGEAVYSDNGDSFESWFAEILPVFEEMLGTRPRNSDDFITSPIVQFTSAISIIKHQAFKEEREVRICATPLTYDAIRLAPKFPLKDFLSSQYFRGKFMEIKKGI